MPSPHPADHDVIDVLDSFHCHNVSFALVVDLLAAETHRKADVVAALAGS